MLIPYGYGYCRIQVPGSPPDTSDWYQACKFDVANKSKINYKEIKIEAESKGHYIHKKIIGYRPEFDLYLYADDLHEDGRYGLNLTKNEFFQNNSPETGDVLGTTYDNLLYRGSDLGDKIDDVNIDEWHLWADEEPSNDPENVWIYLENGNINIAYSSSDNDPFIFYQDIDYSLHDGDEFKITLHFKAENEQQLYLRTKFHYNDGDDSGWYNIFNEDINKTYSDGDWHWITKSGKFDVSNPDISNFRPQFVTRIECYIQINREADNTENLITIDYIHTSKVGKQGDLLQFMRRLRQNPREDGSIIVYPITGDSDSGFWDIYKDISEVRCDRFIIDDMEILDAVEGEKELGNVLHIQGREADIISKDEFDSLIYRDTRTGKFNRIPHYTESPPPTKAKPLPALLAHRVTI